MPLVVPGVTADNLGSDKTQEWMNKLAGKVLCDGPSTETVSLFGSTFVDEADCPDFRRPFAKPTFLSRHESSSRA